MILSSLAVRHDFSIEPLKSPSLKNADDFPEHRCIFLATMLSSQIYLNGKMLLLLTSFTALYLFVGIFYFGRKKADYSHFSNTISELGEIGTTLTQRVSFGLFLPVGMLLFLIAWLSPATVLTELAVCVGLGYVIAAFFPCDVGSPSSGSARQQIHNLGGAIEYLGSAYVLFQFANQADSTLFQIGAIGLLAGTVFVSIADWPLRGLVQLSMEVILVGYLLTMSWGLAGLP